MAIQIVNEYPAPSRLLRRLARASVWLLGALLILTGLLASISPIIYVVTVTAPDPGVAIATVVAVASFIVGLWLIRGRRRLVLFLRRFGFTEATQAVTFAVVKAL